MVDLACGEQFPDRVLEALKDAAVTKTAFNAAFERTCISRYLGRQLSPASWQCTAVQSAMLALPLTLDGVGEVLSIKRKKLKEGVSLLRYFSMPCKPTKANGGRTRNRPEDAPELWERFNLNTKDERAEPKSVAFINSTLQDNKLLMQRDPSYLANLKALPTVERERLLYGNWKIKQAAGLFFKRTQVRNMLPVVPSDITKFVRAWDLAATPETEKGDPAYTAGVLMGKRPDGSYVVIDVINVRQSASDVRATIRHTAEADNARYGHVRVRLPQDPGQAGKDQAESFIKLLSGFSVTAVPVSGSKEARAEPTAAQWQAGNFDVVVGDWNESYFSQLESFPASKFKDMVDATNDAFADLERRGEFGFSF